MSTPKITTNTSYAEDGYPVTRFEHCDTPLYSNPSSATEIVWNDERIPVKTLSNGRIVIGDIY